MDLRLKLDYPGTRTVPPEMDKLPTLLFREDKQILLALLAKEDWILLLNASVLVLFDSNMDNKNRKAPMGLVGLPIVKVTITCPVSKIVVTTV